MSEPSDLNVTLHKIDQESLASIFPNDVGESELLTFLKFSTEQAADEVFWMKSDSSIFYVNSAACQKLGYERDELIGMRVWEWDPLFPKEVWPNFWEELKEKTHIDFETQHQTKQGKEFPVRIKAHFLSHKGEEYLFAYVSDISDMKEQAMQLEDRSAHLEVLVEQRTAELEQEKKKFEEFVNLAPVGIAINRLDDGAFEYINSEFSRFTGYTVEELNKMDYWELTPKEYEVQEQVQLASMSEKGQYGPYQKEYIHKAGHRYPVLLSGIKIKDLEGKEYIWSVVQDISLQKEHEDSLRQAKEQADRAALRMKLANDSAGIGVWEWGLESNTLIWDEWCYKLFGISEGEFSSAYEAWESRVHPDDIGEAKSMLALAVAGEGVYDPEFRVVWPDGNVRVMKAGAEVLRDEYGNARTVVGVNYDVTDLKRKDLMIEEAHKKLQLMTEGSQDGFWHWLDPSQDEVAWSDKFFELLGYDAQEFAPSFSLFQSMLHPDDVEMTLAAVNHAIESRQSFDIEYRIKHKNGDYAWYRGRGTPYYDEQGNFVEMAGSIADISFSKDLEDSLRKTNKDLESSKNEALRSAQVKSQFLANMSHEIRTPMNGIVGLTNLLLGSPLNDEQKDWALGVKASTDTLLTIINDILDISKIESGKLTIESTPFALMQTIHSLVQPLFVTAKSKNIAFSVKTNGIENANYLGDPVRIKQILTNLVNNAIKFTDQGSVNLLVEQKLSTLPGHAKLVFTITDTGIGIPAQTIDSLFQRFAQADSSTTRRFGGTGLGLSICKQLAELMGGDIGCESREGEGSTFWFSLDLRIDSAAGETKQSVGETREAIDLSGLKVLLVEDVKINQVVAESTFQKMGMHVDIASNGLEAVNMVSQSTYDLVFMDCHMPEMDGFEATRKIRSVAAYKNLPIIALTASALKEERDKCISSGMNAVVTKPFESSDIVSAIRWQNIR